MQCVHLLYSSSVLVLGLKSFTNNPENLSNHQDDLETPESLWHVSKTKWWSLLSTFWKGNYDWCRNIHLTSWYFKVNFNIRMYNLITCSTSRQRWASLQRGETCVCWFGSFWYHIFEVHNQRWNNQLHKSTIWGKWLYICQWFGLLHFMQTYFNKKKTKKCSI